MQREPIAIRPDTPWEPAGFRAKLLASCLRAAFRPSAYVVMRPKPGRHPTSKAATCEASQNASVRIYEIFA